MISITSKSPYAVLALAELARSGGSEPVPIGELARRRDVPVQFLEQLFAVLRRGGVISSQRGVKGGYRFAREPSTITVLEIVELLDGPLGRDAQGVFADAADAARRALEQTTIADVLEREQREAGASMYHIELLVACAVSLTRRCGPVARLSSWPMSQIPINIAELVGGTPLVGLPRMLEGTSAADNGVELFAKLEAFNPGGSVKDRIGTAMIEAAEARGPDRAGPHDDRRGHQRQHRHRAGVRLRSQGLSARVDAAAGHEPRAREPAAAYGARVEITSRWAGWGGARRRRARWPRDADVFLPEQFTNPANPEVHRRTTGPEIERALDGSVDVLVAGVGTGGTITGVGEYLASTRTPSACRRRRAARLGRAVGRPAGPHGSRASAPASCRRC